MWPELTVIACLLVSEAVSEHGPLCCAVCCCDCMLLRISKMHFECLVECAVKDKYPVSRRHEPKVLGRENEPKAGRERQR